MTFAIKVEGGTGAGRKRPLRGKPKPWRCGCSDAEFAALALASASSGVSFDIGIPKLQPAYLSRCPVCKQERP